MSCNYQGGSRAIRKFNNLLVRTVCPSCENNVRLELRFAYGLCDARTYLVGDTIIWGGMTSRGMPGRAKVAVLGSDICETCLADIVWGVEIENDKIMGARPLTREEEKAMSKNPEGEFIVIEP